jgi:hypothetical protein
VASDFESEVDHFYALGGVFEDVVAMAFFDMGAALE